MYAYVPARMFTFSTFLYINNSPMLVQVVYIQPLFWWYISRIHTPLCKSPIFSFDSGQNIARLSRIMELHLGSAQGGFLCEISPLPPRRVKLLHFRPQASKNGVFTRQLVYIIIILYMNCWLLGVFRVYTPQTSSGLSSQVVYMRNTPRNYDICERICEKGPFGAMLTY